MIQIPTGNTLTFSRKNVIEMNNEMVNVNGDSIHHNSGNDKQMRWTV